MTSARDLAWTLGAPARSLLLAMIRLYRVTLSGWLGGQCRYTPSCSRYAEDAIRTHGALKGTWLATWRVLRCNPFGRGGVDPVPPGRDRRRAPAYDGVIQSPVSAPSIGERRAG
ncbi:MAG TPA: membrane protein insertion efficiency factor YidD [Actinomycetota bacterium]|nr:membrane protein insertion efficiency factor YidD [Actinomycetota bacterium]